METELAEARAAVETRDRIKKELDARRGRVDDLIMSLRDKGEPGTSIAAALGTKTVPHRAIYMFDPEATPQALRFANRLLAATRERHQNSIADLATAVLRARNAGATYRQIMAATGLTHAYVQQLYMRGRDGTWAFERYKEKQEVNA